MADCQPIKALHTILREYIIVLHLTYGNHCQSAIFVNKNGLKNIDIFHLSSPTSFIYFYHLGHSMVNCFISIGPDFPIIMYTSMKGMT